MPNLSKRGPPVSWNASSPRRVISLPTRDIHLRARRAECRLYHGRGYPEQDGRKSLLLFQVSKSSRCRGLIVLPSPNPDGTGFSSFASRVLSIDANGSHEL